MVSVRYLNRSKKIGDNPNTIVEMYKQVSQALGRPLGKMVVTLGSQGAISVERGRSGEILIHKFNPPNHPILGTEKIISGQGGGDTVIALERIVGTKREGIRAALKAGLLGTNQIGNVEPTPTQLKRILKT